MKSIGRQTVVHNLLADYPFLAKELPAAFPAFAPLSNPALRATLGRVATLERAAGMAGIPVERLLAAIAGMIQAKTGAVVTLEGTPAPDARADKIAALKGIIESLHAGGSLEEARREFEAAVGTAAPEEIAEMEQALIRAGMPVESIHRLCDVHVKVFRNDLDGQPAIQTPPGHPVHTYMAENRAIEQATNRWAALCRAADSGQPPSREAAEAALKDLAKVDIHYTRKENQLFPALEKHGFTGPSKVMWAGHDDIRGFIKTVRAAIAAGDMRKATADGLELARQVAEMIYKEEKILFPTALRLIEPGEWPAIRAGDDAIGYAFVTPGDDWKPAAPGAPDRAAADESEPRPWIDLSTGRLNQEQLDRMLVALPVEISFVDDQDIVQFYSDHTHRLFPRSPGVIGRAVQNCHPQKSLHLVEAILKAFKDGTRDKAQFWLDMQGRFILVSYYAVRGKTGQYLGCLEVTQDVTAIRALTGERRLLEWD